MVRFLQRSRLQIAKEDRFFRKRKLSMTFECEAPAYRAGGYGTIEQINQLFAQGRTMPFFRLRS